MIKSFFHAVQRMYMSSLYVIWKQKLCTNSAWLVIYGSLKFTGYLQCYNTMIIVYSFQIKHTVRAVEQISGWLYFESYCDMFCLDYVELSLFCSTIDPYNVSICLHLYSIYSSFLIIYEYYRNLVAFLFITINSLSEDCGLERN